METRPRRTALSLAFAGLAVLTAPPASAGQAPDGPLRLDAAIAEALRHSPSLDEAADGVVRAGIAKQMADARDRLRITPSLQTGSEPGGVDRRQIGVAASRRLPTGGELRLDADSSTWGTNGSLRDAGMTVALSQPLMPGAVLAARAARADARRGVVGSRRAAAEARRNLVVSVARAYFDVVRQAQLVEIDSRARDRAVRLRAASEARMKVGLATRLDVLRADLLVSQSDAALADARERRDGAIDALDLLLGRPLGAPIAVATGEVDAFLARARTTCAEPLDALVAVALDNRVDLDEARDRVRDAERRLSVARWNLVPDVRLDVGYTRRGLGTPGGGVLNDLFGGWRVGVSTSYAIDGGEAAAAAGTAQLEMRRADRTLRDERQQILLELRRAYRARDRAAAAVAIQARAVDLADQQRRLAELRYERGLAGNLDVVDAETSVAQAQAGLVAAKIEGALAGLALERAAGVLNPEAFHP